MIFKFLSAFELTIQYCLLYVEYILEYFFSLKHLKWYVTWKQSLFHTFVLMCIQLVSAGIEWTWSAACEDMLRKHKTRQCCFFIWHHRIKCWWNMNIRPCIHRMFPCAHVHLWPNQMMVDVAAQQHYGPATTNWLVSFSDIIPL